MKLLFFLIAGVITLCSSLCFSQLTFHEKISAMKQQPYNMVISEDNKFVYVASPEEIQTYNRNDSTGKLYYVSSVNKMPKSTSTIHGAYSIGI